MLSHKAQVQARGASSSSAHVFKSPTVERTRARVIRRYRDGEDKHLAEVASLPEAPPTVKYQPPYDLQSVLPNPGKWCESAGSNDNQAKCNRVAHSRAYQYTHPRLAQASALHCNHRRQQVHQQCVAHKGGTSIRTPHSCSLLQSIAKPLGLYCVRLLQVVFLISSPITGHSGQTRE